MSVRVSVPPRPGVVVSARAGGHAASVSVPQRPATNVDVPARTGSTVGIPGLQGPPGVPGSTATIALPAGDVIQGYRVVRSVDGTVWPVDTGNPAHGGEVVGVALQSVTALGTPVDIRPEGAIEDDRWSWAPGPVYCGADGALTQQPSAAGWLMQVARVVTPTQIDVSLQLPIYRD